MGRPINKFTCVMALQNSLYSINVSGQNRCFQIGIGGHRLLVIDIAVSSTELCFYHHGDCPKMVLAGSVAVSVIKDVMHSLLSFFTVRIFCCQLSRLSSLLAFPFNILSLASGSFLGCFIYCWTYGRQLRLDSDQ